MVLAEAARARLLAALRPWLAAEPRELRVELGLLCSRAVARGVELDAAALGDAVPGSFPARVDRVAVAEVELVASPWAAPGIDAVVRGVDVALTLREPAPKKQRPDIKEWISNEKKRVIAAMDPQGQMLHGKIEDLVSSLEDKFTSVFSSALLNCSKVRFDDVTVQVRYLDDSHLVILRTPDLQFGPELVFRCALFRGLVGSYMPSRKKNHMFVKCDHFEFLLKGNDHTDCTVSLTGTTASVRLDNLHLTAFGIHVTSAFWEIAPKFIPSLMVILEITSQKEDYEVRSGRELWKIAARKLENSIACRRFSLRKAMSCASFWQHYVHTYILLLSLLGYPSGEVIKRNCSRVQSTRKVRETIRNHLKTVSELEEKIPVEAIARGRSAARSKLTVSQQQSEQELSKALLVSNTLKFLSPLLYVWKFLVFICWSLWRFMSSRSRGCKSSVQNFPCASDDSETKVQFSICLGELSVTLLPLSDHHFTGTPKLNNGNKAYHIDTPSVHLVIKSSSILYTDGFTTQSFFFVIGELKADVSGIPKLLQAANCSITRRNSSFGTEEFAEDINSKTILWSDSASMHPFSGKQPDESFSYNGDSSIALLQSDMEELWSFWTVVSTFYNDSGVMHHEKPSVIFEFKSFLIDPYKSTSGFQQCRFTVGRVNLDVDYLCASSTYLLYRQFVHYKELKELTEKSAEFSNRSDSCATHTSGIADKLRSFNQRLKFLIADAIPINTLQISALIAGPSISGSHRGKSAVSHFWTNVSQFPAVNKQVIKGMQMLALNSELGDIKLASFCNRHMDGSTMGTAVEYIIHEETVDCYTELVAEMKLDLEPTHIIVSASRDGLIFNPAMFSNSDINYISSSTVFEGVAALESLDILALGIWFSSRSSSLKLLLDGECTDLLVNLSGIQSVVFENQPQMSICDDILQYSTVLSSSPYDKSQFILSDCVFHLCAGPNKDSLMNDKMQVESISGCSTDSSGIYYFIELEFTEVYIGDYNMHNFLIEVNKPSKQKIALLIHDDLQIVKCKIKGGLIFLETLSLAKFVVCCKIYFRLLMNLSSWAASNSVKDSVTSVSAGNETTVTNRLHVSSGVHSQSEESQLGSVKCLDVDLSQFSLTLAIADESGRYQGLTLEVDAILQQLNLGMKILFEVKRISISSISIMPNTGHVKLRDVPAPRFRSSKSLALPSQSEIPFLEADNVLTYDHDAPSSSNSTVESPTGNPPLELSSHKSYILRHFATYLKLEKKELNGDSNLMRSSGDWFGNGSVSGLEMILSLFAPFHEILSSGSTQKEIQTGDTPHQELLDNRDYTIPDGAIVAIRDLDQQMYVSIKNTGKKYQVVGTYHYSLSSECALFKVKHHKGWRSDIPCISLLSLYAKTDEGKELALSFSHGSDLVEVSSSVDKPSSLWTTSPLRFDGFEDDGDDGKYCKIISRSSYHLVNKKSNYGIAFNDGLLEFVRKPGNPFKVKVLDESLFSDVARPFVPNVNLNNNTYLDVENELPFGMGDSLETGVSSQHVIISIDKIVFTITHEVLDTGNVFPLVQNCINDTRIITQIFPSKIRILSSFKVIIHYFNARKYLWEELVSPITAYMFFRYRFFNLVPVTRCRRMPLRFFVHLKQVDIFVNELSIDILLYVAGKLNVMGPYAVKSSAVFPNCCKIENNSRLTLVCHFQNNEDAIVSGQQSASVFLRHLTFENNHPPDQSVVSISLFKEGLFSTAPINVSLQDSGVFASRTRVLSLKDSRSFSGPFVVVKVSQNSEEGLSLSVQPLLRIYNKSDFPLELRFQRPQKSSEEAAFVTVRSGDMVDESTGISEHSGNFGPATLVKWSEDITGEKAVRISGVMEKLNYNIRRAFSIDSMKSSFSSLSCDVSIDGQHVTALHFLVHTLSREVPLHPTNGSPVFDRNATVAFQLQREIFIYPTVQVYNFLQTDIHVILTDCEPENTRDDNFDIIGKQATITSGSSAYLYVNPAMFTFSVKLISYGSKSKAVNTSDWVKRMQKQISRAQFLDMELEFVIGTGRFHSSLRLLRQEKGFLEVAVFTRYTLHNTSDYPLLCTAPHKKSLPMSGTVKETINLPPQDGCILASMSMSSWFTRSSKLRIGLQHEKGSEAFIDLEALSGFTEFSLEIHDNILPRRMATFGMYLQPVLYDLPVPSQVVLIVPRYVFSNESATAVAVRQCFVEFCPKETGYCWSGPICVSSIGRFFVKFRRSQGTVTDDMKRGTLQDGKWKQFASVDVIQETASFVLHFSKPPKAALPYRIENCLNEASIMYFQKLNRMYYTLKNTPALREIKIDKISPWKPFLKMSQNSRLNIDSSFNNGLSSGKQRFDESFGLRVFKIGYEVYADGLTRVLRICEHKDNPKADNIEHPIANVQFRMTYMCIHLLEKDQQGEEKGQSPSAILAARFQNVSADSVITDRYRHISLAIHAVNMDEKWEGASFGSILRRNKLQDDTLSENILRIIVKLNSTNSSVKQVQYCSIILQPIDLKVDEETLMKIVPFWRTSLAPPGTPSTQFYFRHFEVHPIKIIASFRPGSPYTTYSSAQEALRALLHSVIKVPEISSSAVELNGVLLNHALVTFRELFLKCAQHYSWYVLRAIYVTKGSSLLPPSFASIFDDSASSVIDVFFDPSDGSLNLPGLTIGMFKFISKNMKSGGFSGTKRYLGDLGKTVKTASSNALFAAVTEISDSIVRGAEANGFNGMVTGFHQGILRLAMEPSVLGQAILEGGPDRKIKLDHSPGLNELYIEGYLQAMLDVMYKQEYLRIRVIDDQVILKNLPPNSALINEIVDNAAGGNGFLEANPADESGPAVARIGLSRGRAARGAGAGIQLTASLGYTKAKEERSRLGV
uniref:Vacuolar protein sorting-associated protein 13 VPS13 adaptor binding domain-containing protein n=1 Tax=Oryza meridionalis TaxID=40149 RepID=A0A0E0FDV9_9ORYZ